MTPARTAAVAALALVALLLGWLLFVALPQWYGRPRQADPAQAAVPVEETGGPRINAQLFYVSDSGRTLVGVEREVAYAERTVDQARVIVDAQLEEAPPDLVSPVPPGTKLRALFVTDSGEAFVDLSADIASAHPGGSTYERLTVYALVNALTMNLSAIRAVQLLVDGREVDTLAGHVDLRAPLTPDIDLVEGRQAADEAAGTEEANTDREARPDRPEPDQAPAARDQGR